MTHSKRTSNNFANKQSIQTSNMDQDKKSPQAILIGFSDQVESTNPFANKPALKRREATNKNTA